MTRRASTIEILLVEDNPDDVLLVREAFAETRVKTRIHAVEDGEEALAFLRRESRFSAAVKPDLILLDLNLPRKGGQEVLAEIKSDPRFRRIPVIVLTNSQDEQDVLKAYSSRVNSYITKPSNHDELMDMAGAIEDFWFTVVKLPKD